MPQQYYTLDQAAQILRINPEQLKEMARKKEIRAFQDRSGWRFRSQEIDEMARERGFGSDPELPLGEAVKAKPGDSGRGNEVFNFSLDADESDEVPLGKQPTTTEKPSRSGSGSRKGSGSKSPPPKASSDSDVRLVIEGGEVSFAGDAGSKAPASKGPISPAPKVGSSRSRMAPPVKDDSGVRIVPLDQPSDSDVKIEPASPHDSAVPMPGRKVTKRASDSDIRIEEATGHAGKVDQNVTEEIDLDAEERKAKDAQSKAGRRPKPASSPSLPTKSPFELSESDFDVNGPAAGQPTQSETDSSSDFELKPMGDSSSPIEVSSDELLALKSDDDVSLGEVTGGKGASGINLRDPADSGISLEPGSSEDMDLSLSLEPGRTPKPAPIESETDSSSDFDLSDDGSSSPTEGSSEFELSLQEDDASPTEGSSSEFELSLDAEGADVASGADSDSEFELTLDDSGGLSAEQDASGSSDFDVGSLNEESDSEAVALDEGETDLESSEFDLSLEGDESGSQVVPLEDEEEFDEGAATVQRKAAGAAAGEDLGEELDEDLDEAPAAEADEEVEPAAAPVAAAAPADWGVAMPLVSLLTTIFLFVVTLMSFELIQGMWGYHTGNKVSNMIIHPIAKMVSGEDKLPEN